MESRAGAAPLLAGQTSIDDVLEQAYDLTPQLIVHFPDEKSIRAQSAPRRNTPRKLPPQWQDPLELLIPNGEMPDEMWAGWDWQTKESPGGLVP